MKQYQLMKPPFSHSYLQCFPLHWWKDSPMPVHQKDRLHFLLYYWYYHICLSATFLDHWSQRKDHVTADILTSFWSFADVQKSTILLKSLPISSLYLLKVYSSVVLGMVFAISPFSNVKTYSLLSRSLWNVVNLLIAFGSRSLYDSFVFTLIATLLSCTVFKTVAYHSISVFWC